MKPAATIGIIVVVIIAIVIGLIAYSYTQIQISLESISYQGLDVSLTTGSVSKAIFNGLIGNWLGAALDLITGVKLGLGFALSNHGIFPVYIPDVSYDLLVNDVKVGQGQSQIGQTINSGETKNIDDTQDIQFSSIKSAASSIIESGGIINLQVSGTAYFSFLGLSVPVPFEATKQVNVVDELKSKLLGSSQNSGYSNSYQPPSTIGTSINIQASSYTVTEGQQVTFSGLLTDSNGNGISDQPVYVKRDITLAPDSVLSSSYTDSNGGFSVTWAATKPFTSNTANVYATFDGSTQYSSARSSDISVQVMTYQPQSTIPPIQTSPTTQTARFSIANSQYQVGPGTYTSIPFNMQCSGTATGSFSASAALGDNIIVYIMDSSGLSQFQAGQSATTYYNSGKIESGNFNIGLPSGQYYLILSNMYSSFSTKNVILEAYYTCS